MNRELSWLDFNERVLQLVEDDDLPVLERAKFLAIYSQNLDEFFQVRVAGLQDQLDARMTDTTADGLTPAQQLDAIAERVTAMVRHTDNLFLNDLVPALAAHGVRLTGGRALGAADRAHLTAVFEKRIFSMLTPLAMDRAHPFPYISTLSLNLGVLLSDPLSDETRFARIKVPPRLERFVRLPDGERFVTLEDIIGAHLHRLFPGMEVSEISTFRVTRNADLLLEEEDADDLLEAVEMEVRRRRFGNAVRLEIAHDMSDEMASLLRHELELSDAEIFRSTSPLDLGGLWSIVDIGRPDLLLAPIPAMTPAPLAVSEDPEDFFDVIRRRDVLYQHPYESFGDTTEEFIRRASLDPAVAAIKITLYRTSGDSPIVESLTRAAESGKQVVTLVELKARFDEANNIEWARHLEQAGVHVVYGIVGLKTHSKVTLVVREEEDGIRCYTHIGTGNYNPRTARLYEDLGMLTSNETIGIDAQNLFNYLTGFSRNESYGRLLVAPFHLRSEFTELIRNERRAEPGTGHITMKVNSLTDPGLIDELYDASCDGVRINLLVRGICCLRPGIPGLSENITVRSILGRYLEHSRIYRFANGNGPGVPSIYMGSADLMTRNVDRRVEVLVEVGAAEVGRLDAVFDIMLQPDARAWSLDDGTWHLRRGEGTVDCQVELHNLARGWRR